METNFTSKLARDLSKRVRENQFSGVVLVCQGETDLFRRAYGYASRTWKIKKALNWFQGGGRILIR
jgi:hypothetical protein